MSAYHGISFLDGKTSSNLTELTDHLNDWMNSRQPGDYSKIPGQSSKTHEKKGNSHHREDRSDAKSCTICKKLGHTSDQCWFRKDSKYGESSNSNGSNNNRSSINNNCFICNGTGHRSYECPQKKSFVKKEKNLKEPNMGAFRQASSWISGKVNGTEHRILIDTGASVGVVTPEVAEMST